MTILPLRAPMLLGCDKHLGDEHTSDVAMMLSCGSSATVSPIPPVQFCEMSHAVARSLTHNSLPSISDDDNNEDTESDDEVLSLDGDDEVDYTPASDVAFAKDIYTIEDGSCAKKHECTQQESYFESLAQKENWASLKPSLSKACQKKLNALMSHLMGKYGLEMCLIAIPTGNYQERHMMYREKATGTERVSSVVTPSCGLSELMVRRDIPTVVPDVSMDDRFLQLRAYSCRSRFFAQTPIGLSNDGTCLGTVNILGRDTCHNVPITHFSDMERTSLKLAELLENDGSRRGFL
eukprot:TRINITY_DN11728_c0_g1_i1.p1 TRINITY_DN11728_c0_g1~~TRINITY_DN11728_c0_g1_i1.p1  ORF type:complete len:293 (-),score=62.93 TRINITY_DN11728_c0_g1_i1:355-1233(-)